MLAHGPTTVLSFETLAVTLVRLNATWYLLCLRDSMKEKGGRINNHLFNGIPFLLSTPLFAFKSFKSRSLNTRTSNTMVFVYTAPHFWIVCPNTIEVGVLHSHCKERWIIADARLLNMCNKNLEKICHCFLSLNDNALQYLRGPAYDVVSVQRSV